MSLVIINIFQCSGLKATVCPSIHTHKKSHFGRTCTWKNLSFCIEEGLLCFLRRSCFSSTNRPVCMLCMLHWHQSDGHPRSALPLGHMDKTVFQYPNFTPTASVHRRLISHDKTGKKPLHNNAILCWVKARSGCSPLNKGKNGERKMRSIPVPKAAMNSSAIGCTKFLPASYWILHPVFK